MAGLNVSSREFGKILKRNGFKLVRQTGDHNIYKDDKGRLVSVPMHLNPIIAQRLVRENNLKL